MSILLISIPTVASQPIRSTSEPAWRNMAMICYLLVSTDCVWMPWSVSHTGAERYESAPQSDWGPLLQTFRLQMWKTFSVAFNLHQVTLLKKSFGATRKLFSHLSIWEMVSPSQWHVQHLFMNNLSIKAPFKSQLPFIYLYRIQQWRLDHPCTLGFDTLTN